MQQQHRGNRTSSPASPPLSVTCTFKHARVMLGLLAMLISCTAFAHKPSDSYLTLRPDGTSLQARWDIALRDLDAALVLDVDQSGTITWSEVSSRRDELFRFALAHLQLGACTTTPGALEIVRHSDGNYAVLHFTAACPAPVTSLEVDYTLLFDLDAQHRGLLRPEGEGAGAWVAFSASEHHRTVEWKPVSDLQQLGTALAEGVHHITIGWDHLCFLFALLLPSVLRRKNGVWESAPSFKPAFFEVLKVVSSFTVAHSLTLGLAAFGVVAPDAKWVEVAIAASVVLAAFNNLVPFIPDGRWSLAFGLGLLHGFGFVSALQDLGGGARLWVSVLGFNLGVETGQLAIVSLFVPVAFALRRTLFYRWVLRLGSLAIFVVALWWVIQRIR